MEQTWEVSMLHDWYVWLGLRTGISSVAAFVTACFQLDMKRLYPLLPWGTCFAIATMVPGCFDMFSRLAMLWCLVLWSTARSEPG